MLTASTNAISRPPTRHTSGKAAIIRAHVLLIALYACMGALASTIDLTNRTAHGANIGWINARGDGTNGAVVGQFFCTGFVWSANCGWINLGYGPLNGWRYANTSNKDWGVNIDRSGNLRGFAYGANIGWIKFETNGNPRLDRNTGNFSGHAHGANIGWVTLSNLYGFARTATINPGPDLDSDGIPDAWEFSITGSLTNLTANGDSDGDGIADAAEYLADTSPTNSGSFLQITAIARDAGTNRIAWTVEPTRQYRLEHTTTPTNHAPWTDTGLGLLAPGPASTLTGLVTDVSATSRFYRARAILPLAP